MASPSQSPELKPSTSSTTSPSPSTNPLANPLLRNTLLTALSPEEYKTLHRYAVKRAPALLRKKVISPSQYKALVKPARGDGGDVAALRVSLRMFVGVNVVLKLLELVTAKLAQRKGKTSPTTRKIPYLKSDRFLTSASLSLCLLLHRLLFRFFNRLRVNLLIPDAEPFRRRNPRLSRALTSEYAPAVGASLAGLALGYFPDKDMKVTLATVAAVQSGEFLYNAAEMDGLVQGVKPWWVGSWMFLPVACSELLYTFVFQRDTFPEPFGGFILKHTPDYIQRRPASFPKDKPWPNTYEIVDALGEIAHLRWPPFLSPILHPNDLNTLPPSLTQINPITSRAHPLLEQTHSPLSCALLHPTTPSCLVASLNHTIQSFVSITRFIFPIYAAFSIPAYKKFIAAPLPSLNKLSQKTLKTSSMLTAAIATAWGSICLFNQILPRKFLPTQRWLLSGFLAGCWGFIDRSGGRAQFLYSLRAAIVSTFQLGKVRGWWKGGKGGDVAVIVCAIAVLNVLYQKKRDAITEKPYLLGIRLLQGPQKEKVMAVKKERRESVGVVDNEKVEDDAKLEESGVLVEKSQ